MTQIWRSSCKISIVRFGSARPNRQDGALSRIAPRPRDLARILATSARTWAEDGRRRYAALLTAAMRQAASDPEGRMTRDRSELLDGLRSLHLRHVQIDDAPDKVKQPVHCLYYRPIEPGLIDIIRVLHERMDPTRHLGAVRSREV